MPEIAPFSRCARLGASVALRTAALALGCWAVTGVALAEVAVTSVPVPTGFADAVAPGALRWTCARDMTTLTLSFGARQTPFDATLVHERDGQLCHIDYTPSLAGFRAHPDDLPATELYINVDSLALVARRATKFGDALDISAQIVQDLDRPLSVVLSMEREIPMRWYAWGTEALYGNRAHMISWRSGGAPNLQNPWTQDFMKSGVAQRTAHILVPRKLFEGREEDGAAFAPLLEGFRADEGFARSHLSWEGGDLQFVRDPRDRRRLVLVHGQSARAYWGDALTDEEYGYVLRREFGADASIDVGGIAPHTDYFVSFIPEARIALVSEPVTDSLPIARAAVGLLSAHFGRAIPPTVAALARALDDDRPLSSRRSELRGLIAAARAEAEGGWPTAGDPGLYGRVHAYVTERCPTDPSTCFSGEGLEALIENDPVLLRDWLAESRRTRSDGVFTTRLVDLVESQVEPLDRDLIRLVNRKVAEIAALGFEIVRVPRFGSDQNRSVEWAGLGYANNLLVDHVLYVPVFGLGEVETRIIADLEAALPEAYRVVPTYARHMLLHNGGVHCTVAIIRRPQGLDTFWRTPSAALPLDGRTNAAPSTTR